MYRYIFHVHGASIMLSSVTHHDTIDSSGLDCDSEQMHESRYCEIRSVTCRLPQLPWGLDCHLLLRRVDHCTKTGYPLVTAAECVHRQSTSSAQLTPTVLQTVVTGKVSRDTLVYLHTSAK